MTLAGYSLLEEISSTNRAVVQRALRNTDGTPVIIKTVRRNNDELVARCKNHFDITHDRPIRGVARALDFITATQSVHLILEDAGPYSLRTYLQRFQPSVEVLLDIANQVATSLDHLHATRTIHRDLSPDNIVIGADKTRATITDLGLAVTIPVGDVGYVSNIVEGTLDYISPEQTGRIQKPTETRSDLYSLGAVLYNMFCGVPPFEGSDALELIHAHLAKTPEAPITLNPEIPQRLSDLILRLLEKDLEHRYQSAFGVAQDLKRLLGAVRSGSNMQSFQLENVNTTLQFRPSNRVFGREAERKALNQAMTLARKHGTQLFFIGGTAGSGKTAIVDSFVEHARNTNTLIARGKFEQFVSGQPMSALATAIGSLLRGLLRGSDESVDQWKSVVNSALELDGSILETIIPEIKLFANVQQPEVPVGAREAKVRLVNSATRLITELSRNDHTVVLVLDDLQWADDSTFDVLTSLVEHEQRASILIVGTYRSEETTVGVNSVHSIRQMPELAKRLHSLSVLPLSSVDVQQILSAALTLETDQLRLLTEIVMERTKGHALFVQQFLAYLVENGLLKFNRQTLRWDWRAEDLRAVPITFDVQDIIAARFNALDDSAKNLLSAAACFGLDVEVSKLSSILGQPYTDIVTVVDVVVSAGLLRVNEGLGTLRVSFTHDRVQQIALESASAEFRAQCHATIARSILREADDLSAYSGIYELAHHIVESRQLLTSSEDKLNIVRVLSEAALRSRNGGALHSAYDYGRELRTLLGEDGWKTHTAIVATATLLVAECAGGLGYYDEAHTLFDEYVTNGAGKVEQAHALSLKAQLLIREGRFRETLDVGVQALKLLDVDFDPNINKVSLGIQLVSAIKNFSSGAIEKMRTSAFNDDPRLRIADDLLFAITSPGYNFSIELLGHITISRAELARRSGHAHSTIDAYVGLGLVFVGIGMFPKALHLAEASLHLADRSTDDGAIARSMLMTAGHVYVWTNPLSDCLDLFEAALEHAIRSGNQFLVYWAAGVSTEFMLFAGKPLTEVHTYIHRMMEVLHRVYQRSDNIPWTATYFEAAVARVVGSFDNLLQPPHELQKLINAERTLIEDMKSSNDATAVASWCTQTLRIAIADWNTDLAHQAIALFSDYEHGANTSWIDAEITTLKGIVYGQAIVTRSVIDKKQLALLKKCAKRVGKWAKLNPATFSFRAKLLKAILCIANDKSLDALTLLRSASMEAREEANMYYEALALEWSAVAAERSVMADIATVYREKAAKVYRLWGANTIAERFEQTRPTPDKRIAQVGRSTARVATYSTATINILKQNIDVDSIFKASSAISGVIIHRDLVQRLLEIVLENAGANKGALIMERGNDLVVEAVADSEVGTFSVISEPLSTSVAVCRGAVQLSARTHEAVVVESVSSNSDYSGDPFVQEHGVRSLMVIPVQHQGRTIGQLHLANTKASYAFTPDRIEVVRLLTSQIAVSLENARLYEEQKSTLDSAARFVPTEFLDSLGIDSIRRVSLGDAVNVRLTVLFADIRRFTSLSEKLSVDQTFGFLNEFLSAVTPAIRRNNGFIDKYVGDAIMAIFPESPDDGVRASIELLRDLKTYNEQRLERGEEEVQLGIGIHYGEVMLGTVGTDDRMDTTVIGDTVNIAARLEELTKQHGSAIYISDDVKQHLQKILADHLQERGVVEIRGREVQMTIHEVVAPEGISETTTP